ncbi:MAG TPA: LLM class flavin-dependent oxidoreductase [Acidimicrobiales bacterium]|nr:LLM class flavin-dependent oxidoreductase [Acidimicrobiales bacterium]
MTLAVGIGVAALGRAGTDFVVEAERLGADSVWAAEFWAGDALTPLAYLAARTSTIRLGTGILQLGSRTPAMLAMSALSMQALSDGRFLLGLGTSGPQVMEGWHGVRFDLPVQRTRETIDIVRKVARGERLEHSGRVYELPLPGGEGRAIRSQMPKSHVPIYVASLGPANLRLTGELADGWIGNSFFPETADAFFGPMREGATAAGRKLTDLDLTVAVGVEFTDDVEEAGRRHADGYAFTFGAMGSATTNFYNDAFARQGYGEDVHEVQRLWRSGDQDAARRRVPIEIGLGTNLIGTDEMVRARLRLYRDAGVSTLRAGLGNGDLDTRLATLGRLLGLVREVDAEASS